MRPSIFLLFLSGTFLGHSAFFLDHSLPDSRSRIDEPGVQLGGVEVCLLHQHRLFFLGWVGVRVILIHPMLEQEGGFGSNPSSSSPRYWSTMSLARSALSLPAV